MNKKSYEVISDSKVVNMNNETVDSLKKGQTVSGEMVLIKDQTGQEIPYVEIEDGKVVLANNLAEKLDTSSVDDAKIESQVKGSNKKIIFAVVGALVGFGIAHYMKKDTKMKVVFTLAGLGLGLGAEYLQNKKSK